MELTVKFVDYGNGISVSKVDPRCGRSVTSAVWSQRHQQRKSFSLILLTLEECSWTHPAEDQCLQFAGLLHQKDQTPSPDVCPYFLHGSNSIRFHNLDGCFWLSRSSDAVTRKLKQRLCIRRVLYATMRSAAYAKQLKTRLLNSLYTWAMRFVLI